MEGMRFYLTFPLLLSAALLGCGSTASPSDQIKCTSGIPPLLPSGAEGGVVIQCDGPSSEVGKLGPLCGYHGSADWRGRDADMAVALGPSEGPYLVVLGFVPDTARGDMAAAIKYDVRLVEGPREGDADDEIDAWSDGTSLAGEMVTQHAIERACDVGTFVAGGSLRHGNVTIKFGFSAGQPC
jgi:hypothetical protein